MGVVGDLRKYTQFQAAEAMRAAAANPGGDAGAGIGMGMGMAMARQIGEAIAGEATAAPATPPPLPQEQAFHVARDGQPAGPFPISELKRQIEAGELTRVEPGLGPGMTGWASAQSVAELGHLFAATPPPMPGCRLSPWRCASAPGARGRARSHPGSRSEPRRS